MNYISALGLWDVGAVQILGTFFNAVDAARYGVYDRDQGSDLLPAFELFLMSDQRLFGSLWGYNNGSGGGSKGGILGAIYDPLAAYWSYPVLRSFGPGNSYRFQNGNSGTEVGDWGFRSFWGGSGDSWGDFFGDSGTSGTQTRSAPSYSSPPPPPAQTSPAEATTPAASTTPAATAAASTTATTWDKDKDVLALESFAKGLKLDAKLDNANKKLSLELKSPDAAKIAALWKALAADATKKAKFLDLVKALPNGTTLSLKGQDFKAADIKTPDFDKLYTALEGWKPGAGNTVAAGLSVSTYNPGVRAFANDYGTGDGLRVDKPKLTITTPAPDKIAINLEYDPPYAGDMSQIEKIMGRLKKLVDDWSGVTVSVFTAEFKSADLENTVPNKDKFVKTITDKFASP